MLRVVCAACLLAALGGCSKKPRPTDGDDPLSALLGGAKSGGPKAADGGPSTPAAAGTARPSLPAGWIDFKHPEGVMSVYLPAPPQPKRGNQFGLNRPVPPGHAFMSDYFAQADGLYCECGVMVYSPELVDGVRNAPYPLAAGATRTPVTWAGRAAVEDVSENPQSRKVEVKRRVWVENRAYYCNLYGQAAGRPTAAERAAVFDSFVTR